MIDLDNIKEKDWMYGNKAYHYIPLDIDFLWEGGEEEAIKTWNYGISNSWKNAIFDYEWANNDNKNLVDKFWEMKFANKKEINNRK